VAVALAIVLHAVTLAAAAAAATVVPATLTIVPRASHWKIMKAL
jgi:hypothetical protein